MEKLKHVMQWREEEGAPTMLDLIALANGPESAPEAVEDPEGLTKAKAVAPLIQGGKETPPPEEGEDKQPQKAADNVGFQPIQGNNTR